MIVQSSKQAGEDGFNKAKVFNVENSVKITRCAF